MKIFIFIILIFFASIIHLLSQKETTNWNFGQYGAITFNTHNNEPIFVNGSKLDSWEGCASISDKNGNLLFYTNGVTVWNKNNIVMDGGSGLLGHYSATQSSIAFRRPLHANQYYIFTVDAVESNSRGLNMSIVDMSQNDGLGKVTTKNINIHPKPIERVLAIPHANRKDFWVIVHISQTTNYLAYKVDENGVVGDPVISNGINTANRPTGHTLKSTIDGKRIASTHSFAGVIELFDFDNYSGKMTLTNNLQHPYFSWPYGVEFSPDGKYLYASLFKPCRLIQMDVSKQSEQEILNSMIILAENQTATFYYGSLQLGINGKIYVAQDEDQYLGVIKKPNELGKDCGFVSKGLAMLNGASSRLGLPTFVQNYIAQVSHCDPKGDELVTYGDFESKEVFFSSSLNEISLDNINEFQNPGSFAITNVNPINQNDSCVQFGKDNNFVFCHTLTGLNDVITYETTVEPNSEYLFSFDFIPVSDKSFSNLSIFMNGVEIQNPFLHAEGPCVLKNYVYEWTSGANQNLQIIISVNSESPEIFALDNISLRSCDCPTLQLKKLSHDLCYGGIIQLFGYNEDVYSHSWKPNIDIDDITAPNPNVKPKKSTVYSLTLTNKITGCVYYDSVWVNVLPIKDIEISGDNYLCSGDSTEVFIQGDFENIEWSTGQSSKSIIIKSPGTYLVKCFDSNGCEYNGSIDVYWIDVPDIQIIGPNSVCKDESFELEVDYKDAKRYLWSTGESTPKITKLVPGTYTVEIILSDGCSTTLTKTVNEISPAKLEPQHIDIGEVCLQEISQIDKSILNSNDFNVLIDKIILKSALIGLTLSYESPLPYNLKPKGNFKLNFEYSTMVYDNVLVDTLLVILTEPCYSEISIPITGKISETKSKVWIADTTVIAGDYICIPIYATMFCEEFITGKFKYRLMCDMSKSFFEPDSVASGTMVVDDKHLRYYIIEIEDTAILEENNNIVNYICGTVLSPDSSKYSVNISDFEWSDIQTETDIDNGLFDVDYCVYTIRQLISIKLSSITLKPNVTDGAFAANIVSSEVGNFNIIITNSIGNEIYRSSWVRNSKSEPDENEMLIDLSEFPSGVYNVIMISPWSTNREKVLLVK
ncbi:MAG: hypothetical protein CVV22_02190 [Ignavibacteriae bacterium HGW-Ignavibacteriae-1]|jgi:hypothetical protein|nr:MAG: hypothetical protein CVV22_02190 [Ignavibacteriae bacterium HGW-Ignavibacteriae-1]